ncbi:MAG: FAD-dependent oxidoreductase [Clostridia bacterium]|nr:FAD-dependent oxidoreductase [Clostridia bacterium]
MKKITAICTALLLAVGSVSACAESAQYTPGTYTGKGTGIGEVTVTVTVDEKSITDVEIDVSNETPEIGGAHADEYKDAILAAQSAEIDSITGATATSQAVITAAQLALDLAQGKAVAEEAAPTVEGNTADVIVVGAGGAGLAAAISAADQGASVILLESQETSGGTAKISAVHYSVINPEWDNVPGQRDEALEERLRTFLTYDPADFGEYADVLVTLQKQVTDYLASDDTTDFDSVERMLIEHYVNVILTPGPDRDGVEAHAFLHLTRPAYENTMDVYNFLLASGVTFEDEPFDIRSLTPTGEGVGFTNTMTDTAQKRGVRIDYLTTATSLLLEGERVVGVQAKDTEGNDVTYTAQKGVILATGGFGSNPEMIAKYDNRYAITVDTPSSEGKGATGLGIEMAQAIGADTVDMQFIQVFPFPALEDFALVPSIMTAMSAKMAVNADAQRIADDSQLGPYDAVTLAARQEEGQFYYLVGDAESAERWQGGMAPKKSVFIADTLEEVAEMSGLDPVKLQETVDKFNGYVDAGVDPDFGRTDFHGKIENAPFAIVKYANKVQQTMGGLVIDADAHVLNTDGQVIPGLYAAGEVTGGLEGADRVHGDNYAEIFYYGKVAGENAAAAK